MIYVDEIRDYGAKGKWCHMWTDGDITALHLFAAAIGLKRSWLHESHGISGEFPHYDLTPPKRKLALEYGAEEMALADWIKQRIANKGKSS